MSTIPPAKITYNQIETKKTKLQNKFSFWYRISEDLYQTQAKQHIDKKEYENQVKKIAEFDSIEDFWAIFQHLRKLDSCKPGIEFQMFKDPVKPMWEDENNKNGGRITIKLRKGFTTIIWEEMIFAIIGDVLPKEIKDEINGIVVTSRKDFNTLQIWTKSFNEEVTSGIEKNIREILSIPKEVVLDIKPFNMPNKENNYYNNYNNYKGNYQKKKQNNNYYKKYENNNRDYKHSEKINQGNKIENEVKEENENKKNEELNVEKKESKESKESKDSKEIETPKEKEDFKEVKKKKKKKKD